MKWVTVSTRPRGNCFCSPAFPFTRGSSQPRDRTQVSLIAGRFFTGFEPQGKHRFCSPASQKPLPLFSSVQSSSSVMSNSATSWTVACQASLSITTSPSLIKLMSTEWVMPSHHLILCRPLLLLPSIFPSIRVFSSESVLHIGWPFPLCKRVLKLLPISWPSVTK